MSCGSVRPFSVLMPDPASWAACEAVTGTGALPSCGSTVPYADTARSCSCRYSVDVGTYGSRPRRTVFFHMDSSHCRHGESLLSEPRDLALCRMISALPIWITCEHRPPGNVA